MTEDKKEKGVPFDWLEGMSEMMSKFCAGESGFPDCASMAEMMKMKGWCGGPGAKEAGEEGEEKKSTCC